jgi:hypothetical protein
LFVAGDGAGDFTSAAPNAGAAAAAALNGFDDAALSAGIEAAAPNTGAAAAAALNGSDDAALCSGLEAAAPHPGVDGVEPKAGLENAISSCGEGVACSATGDAVRRGVISCVCAGVGYGDGIGATASWNMSSISEYDEFALLSSVPGAASTALPTLPESAALRCASWLVVAKGMSSAVVRPGDCCCLRASSLWRAAAILSESALM